MRTGRIVEIKSPLILQPGPAALTDGIGLSNVNERLSVIYGAAYRVRMTSVSGLGTIIRLEIPDMVSAEPVTA